MKSTQRRTGRYVQGGSTTDLGDRIGWWERRIFRKHSSDTPLVLSPKYDKRPDLLAYDMYGRASLMWVILQYNNIIDSHVEFTEGATIVLPTSARLFGELLNTPSR